MTKTKKDYQLVCGLEIHAELKTASKMFCGCKNDPFHAPQPNIYTCPVCLGMPGGLPVPNQKAVEWTLKLGLALNCKVNLFSKFDRKHYFYPDLPKGYQISQYDIPFCSGGYIETSYGRVKITRIHLEEDTGKLLHKTVQGQKVSLVDFNRSGVPLVEIVSEPDITSPEQAKEYGKKLRQIIRYLDIGDCDMEQGGMRLEANISLQDKTDTSLPDYKVEVKNINSFRFLEQAIKYEIKRQTPLLEEGETPVQETRGYNPQTGKTFSQRTKENAEDYRYFPEPDIPPIQLNEAQLDELRKDLPALPSDLAESWYQDQHIELRFGEKLISSQPAAKFLTQLFTATKKQKLDANKLASMIVNGKLKANLETDQPESEIKRLIKEFLAATQTDQVDETEIMAAIGQAITDNPQEVAAFRSGKTALVNFFVGQVMKIMHKKLDMRQLKSLLETELNNE